jgi:hypothetical protein
MTRDELSRKGFLSLFLFVVLLAPFPAVLTSASQDPPPVRIVVGDFSSQQEGTTLPEGWKPLTFKNIKRHTSYKVVDDNGTAVLEAVADASASGLVRSVKIDPKEYPIVEWSWKAKNILVNGNVHRKSGDDYPARLYITFDYNPGRLGLIDRLIYGSLKLFYGEAPPLRAINYIWESKAPVGTIVPNPYTDWIMMIVIESGRTKLGQWVNEERNIYEDYRKAFGEDPKAITGVAVMTDTDNTGERAVAYYGDILFKKRKF